jgi:hypothetical protein
MYSLRFLKIGRLGYVQRWLMHRLLIILRGRGNFCKKILVSLEQRWSRCFTKHRLLRSFQGPRDATVSPLYESTVSNEIRCGRTGWRRLLRPWRTGWRARALTSSVPLRASSSLLSSFICVLSYLNPPWPHHGAHPAMAASLPNKPSSSPFQPKFRI